VVTIALNKEDEKRARQIMNYPWFKEKRWQNEMKKMMESKVKLELEALSSRGISFISEQYLPNKIRNDDYLD
jgi:DNA topoisomerase-6 subunit A